MNQAFFTMNIDNKTVLEPEKANLELLLNEIKKEMIARNYTRTDNPELKINIGIVVTEEAQTRETTIGKVKRLL